MAVDWEQRYAHRTQHMSSSAIRELLKLTEQPDFISFAGGLPASEVFPVKQIADATDTVLKEVPEQALQYSTTEGYKPLRTMIARDTAKTGFAVSIDNVLITSGSQQALDLIGKLFIDPGDRILVECPTYLGALQAWNAYEAQYVSVPSDEHGMMTSALEQALEYRPKLIYLVPNFQNPTGVTLSLERRRQLVDIANRYRVPIVEDDPYGQLRFEGEHLPSVLTLDGLDQGKAKGDGTYHGHVVYLSTFSKILAPGFRLAWLVGPSEMVRRLVQAKQGVDLHTSTFGQMVAYEVARDGFLQEHAEVIRRVYHERRDVMLQALQEHFPAGVKWNKPEGGMFLWCVLPEGMDAARLLEAAVSRKVAFVPGASFFPCGGGDNTMRLNFSNASPDIIREGIARLGDVLHAALESNTLAAQSEFKR